MLRNFFKLEIIYKIVLSSWHQRDTMYHLENKEFNYVASLKKTLYLFIPFTKLFFKHQIIHLIH